MCQTVLIFTKRIDTFRSGSISKFGPKNETKKISKKIFNDIKVSCAKLF